MKPQVAYRIELSELEKRIKKYLRRVDENDSLEFVKNSMIWRRSWINFMI